MCVCVFGVVGVHACVSAAGEVLVCTSSFLFSHFFPHSPSIICVSIFLSFFSPPCIFFFFCEFDVLVSPINHHTPPSKRETGRGEKKKCGWMEGGFCSISSKSQDFPDKEEIFWKSAPLFRLINVKRSYGKRFLLMCRYSNLCLEVDVVELL